MVVDLNVSTSTTSLAYLFATLTINWLQFYGLNIGDMFFLQVDQLWVACQVLHRKLAFFSPNA